MNAKKNRLGRGLDALLPTKDLVDSLHSNEQPGATAGQALIVNIHLLDPNPDQPRQHFDEKELAALSQSIKAKGIIIPLVVQKKDDGRYEIIAGERRLRAAKIAKLDEVPVIIKEKTEEAADRLLMALLENLCREDLNPIEEAESFQRLNEEFGKIHQEIATLSGRDRSTVTNALRLLTLPDFVQDDIRFKRLSSGHGRAMASIELNKLAQTDPQLYTKTIHDLRTEILTKSLTVRQTEALIKRALKTPKKHSESFGDDVYFEALSKSFSNELGGLKVAIHHAGKSKKLEIFYSSTDELEWLMKKFGVNAA